MSDFRKNKPHVLIVPSWYKTPETPVLGTFFEEQARSLKSLGFTVGIIYPQYTPPSKLLSKVNQEQLDFYMDDGIPTFNIKTQAGIPKLRRLSYTQFGKAVNTVFEKYVKNFGKPDIIHAHSIFHGGIAGYHIAKVNNIPFVITEHLTSFLMGTISNSIDIEISKEIFENAAGSIIVSNNFKNDLESQLKLKKNTFTVIHNLVNDLFFDSYTPKSYSPEETFHFFTNSFLTPRKNIQLIIDSLKVLIDKGMNVHLTIGGHGELDEQLKSYVTSLGLDNNVTFTGKLWRQEVKNELDKCHAFLLASNYETFGVVLIESLACGRPVVTTDSGGPRDFIHEEQGILVKEHDIPHFSDAMIQIINDYNNYNQTDIIEYCKANFNENKIASEIVQFYESIAERELPKNNVNSISEQKKLLITFDYELFLGRKSGSVASCLINPTNLLLDILSKYKVNAIFFVDTIYLMRLKEQAEHHKVCADDFKSISRQLQTIIRSGHKVYPHVHPHWLDAKYLPQSNEWELIDTSKYRFHALSDELRSYTFDGSINILKEIISPLSIDYKIEAYRAGGWCIQPFEDFKPYFLKHNIKYEFSVIKGAYQFTDVQYFDFSNAPDKNIYRFSSDICQEDPDGEFTQFNISCIEFDNTDKFINKIWLKTLYSIKGDSSLNKGKGQASKSINGLKPSSSKGFDLSQINHERVGIELMSAVKLNAYLKYFEKNNYMHFISHPKMIENHNLLIFEKFLKKITAKYKIISDFHQMKMD